MSTDFDDEKDFTVCLANKDFQPGQEFTIFYGVRANIDLLVHNGFVFESNDDDCFTMKLGISKNDPLALDKTNFLEELSINRTGLFFIGTINAQLIMPFLITYSHFWLFTVWKCHEISITQILFYVNSILEDVEVLKLSFLGL